MLRLSITFFDGAILALGKNTRTFYSSTQLPVAFNHFVSVCKSSFPRQGAHERCFIFSAWDSGQDAGPPASR